MNQFYSLLYLIVEKKCIDGGKNLGMIEMGIAGKLFQLLKAVGSGHTSSEIGSTNVNGIGTMVDGFTALVVVFGRGEEF